MSAMGAFFTSPGDEVYEDQIVGVHAKSGDLKVNICKAKALTNMRSSGADEKSSTTPAMQLTLEDAVERASRHRVVDHEGDSRAGFRGGGGESRARPRARDATQASLGLEEHQR